jgi:Ca2+-binding RTX toxin-like protein
MSVKKQGQLDLNLGAVINGTERDDVLYGTRFADEIRGFGGNDLIYAGAGDDRVAGEAGDDTLFGEAGSDTIYGGAGRDILSGGDGTDWLYGGAGADRLIGGAGIDIASYADATLGVTAQLGKSGLTNDAQGDTYESIEYLYGSNYGDFLYGDDADNRVEGLAGSDRLYGLGGNDTLVGGNGNDFLDSGDGNDTLSDFYGRNTMTGGAGSDLFYASDAGNVITDFQSGIDKVHGGFAQNGQTSVLGNDGKLAIGYLGGPTGNTFFGANFNSTDVVYYDITTNELRSINNIGGTHVGHWTVMFKFENGAVPLNSDILSA